MKCLVLYGSESEWRFEFLYTALCKHLGAAVRDARNCKVTLGDWPRAKKISGDNLLKFISGNDDIRSVEGNLVFFVGKKYDLGSFLISSMPEMLFIELPDNVELSIHIDILAKKITRELRPDYGYVFHSNENSGSALYASGITYIKEGGAVDPMASLDNDRWFNELVLEKNGKKRYRDDGMLRRIYEVNILNNNHTKRVICGKCLSDLIRENNWGKLERVTDKNWLWRIEGNARGDAEAHLRSCSAFV